MNTYLGDWTLAGNINILGIRLCYDLLKHHFIMLSSGEWDHLLGCRAWGKDIQILVGHLAPSCLVDIHRIARLLWLIVHHICSFLSLLGWPQSFKSSLLHSGLLIRLHQGSRSLGRLSKVPWFGLALSIYIEDFRVKDRICLRGSTLLNYLWRHCFPLIGQILNHGVSGKEPKTLALSTGSDWIPCGGFRRVSHGNIPLTC